MLVLKQFVGQYKIVEWCDVLVFTNDFVQATRTICANYSQGNQVLFGENAGKRCVTMSLTVVIYHHLEDINFWTSSTLNNILTIGNNLYMYISIRCSVQTNDYLLLTDIPCIDMIMIHIRMDINRTFDKFMTLNNHIIVHTRLFKILWQKCFQINFLLNNNCCYIAGVFPATARLFIG